MGHRLPGLQLQGSVEQAWPGLVQVPQLGLQQICPLLQVFIPQGTSTG